MFKYEIHCHTSEVSRCGKNTAVEMVDFYKKCGYTGIVITDHFFNGNCCVPHDISWKEKVEQYCISYQSAKKYGDEIGLDVFFGWEFGGDFVTLGLSPEWLLENEDLDKLTPNEYFAKIHNAGGFVIHAHPFREREYIKSLRIFPREVDAIETINCGNFDFEDSVADYIADRYKLIKVAGSDKHETLLTKLAAVELDFRVNNLDELINAIKNNKHTIKQYALSEKEGNIVLEEYVPVVED